MLRSCLVARVEMNCCFYLYLVPRKSFYTASRFLAQERRRFYRNVTVVGNDGIYEVNLDHWKLKTPLGAVFQIPSYPLALAIANEWMAVQDKVIPSLMHLTGLSNTVIDNPAHLTKFDVVDKALNYLETDTLLFRDDQNDEFIQLQETEWDPVLHWFNKRFEIDLKPSKGISLAHVPESTKEKLHRHLLSHNFWAVTGFLYGIEVLKSVILTIAAAERHIPVDKAVSLSRLETEFQATRWGSVEWSHELEKYDMLSRFSSAALFIYLSSQHYTVKKKI